MNGVEVLVHGNFIFFPPRIHEFIFNRIVIIREFMAIGIDLKLF